MSTSALAPPVAPSPPLRRLLPPAGCAVLFGASVASGSPWLVGLAAVPVLVAIVARPEGATLVFAFSFYLNVPVLIAHAAGVTALGSAFALLLLVPVVAHVILRREALVLTPALGLMVVYLAALVISSIAGGFSPESATAVTNFLAEGLLLYLLVTNAVRTPVLLRLLIWALLLAGALMGALSVWQEATQSYGNTLGGLAQLNAADADTTLHRQAGPLGETNRYAQILLVLLPLAVWAARVERRRALRLAALGCATLILSGMLLTLSRGAGVALVLLAAAMLATGFVRLRHILALALVLAGLVMVVAPDYVARISSLQGVEAATSRDQLGADGAIRGRATENLAAINVFADHPLIGVGPGQFFARYSQQYANELDLRFLETRRRAHNLYLELAADTGVIGLGAFLAIVGTTLVQLWRLARFWAAAWRPELADLALALALSLVAYLASAVFLQLAYQRYFWFLLALGNAAIWILRREATRVSP
jgi:putative inorganic carbon (hco3(-)) transporter